MKNPYILIAFLYFLKTVYGVDDDGIDDNPTCRSCRETVMDFIERRRAGGTRQQMYKIAIDYCTNNTTFGRTYCDGLIKQQLDIALYIIDNRESLNGSIVCNIYLQDKLCSNPYRDDWRIRLPDKPKNIKIKQIKPNPFGKTLKVLHLSDVHFDEKYVEGANIRCGNVLCCRNDSGIANNTSEAAGHWGSIGKCDNPWYTVEEVLNHIRTTHKDIDYVYYTGDVIGHIRYETSPSVNTGYLTKFYRALKAKFKKVYPVLGNNEPSPSQFYAPIKIAERLSLRWLYNLINVEWSSWFSTPSTSGTILRGGFYTLLLRPGIRLIALNSNLCLTSNLWLTYNDRDPYGELEWLVRVLYDAEKKGERVHIIGHVDLGQLTAYDICTRELNRILRRFAHVIIVQINGHSHLDEFRLVYDDDMKEELMYGLSGGSATTYMGLNSNYRIYTIDADTFEIKDYAQYTFNLTDANLYPNRSPNWYKQYSFLDEYNLKEITAKSLGQFYRNMTTDADLTLKYYKNMIRYSDPYVNRCVGTCLQSTLCRIVNIDYQDALKCQSG